MPTIWFNSQEAAIIDGKVQLEVVFEKGSAAVSWNANRPKTVFTPVEEMNFFMNVTK